jgi:hypothetical protein
MRYYLIIQALREFFYDFVDDMVRRNALVVG